MHGIDDLDVRPAAERRQRAADVLEAGAEILPPVARHQQQAAPGREVRELPVEPAAKRGVAVDARHRRLERVDHRVAGDDDASGQAFALAGWPCEPAVGANKQVARQVDDPAIHLLGPGLREVVGAQARLDMSDRDAAIEGSQRGGHRRGGVAMHEHAVRAAPVSSMASIAGKARPASPFRVWSRVIRPRSWSALMPNSVQHLIQHLPVLAGHADNGGRRAGSAATPRPPVPF